MEKKEHSKKSFKNFLCDEQCELNERCRLNATEGFQKPQEIKRSNNENEISFLISCPVEEITRAKQTNYLTFFGELV